MHQLKCDLCDTRVYGFSPRSAAELLEEHMEDRHPATRRSVPSEDLQLADKDIEWLQSMRIRL
jgi:hypothetical protein